MAMLLQCRNKPIGWSEEAAATWGTDPETARLAILGVSKTGRLRIDQHREDYYGIGAGIYPKGFYWKGQDITLDTEDFVQDDNPTNSLIAMALGSAPNGTTGIITNYPDATHNNLRSMTCEMGVDWESTDKYFRVRGLRCQKLELEYAEHLLKRKMTWIGKNYTHAATPVATLPELSSLELFDGQEDGTYTWANPTISGVMMEYMKIIIENKLKYKPVCGGGRGPGFIQAVGRRVSIEFQPHTTGWDFFDLFEGAPNATTGNFDLSVILSKHSAAEYISAALTDCEIISPYEFGMEDTEELYSQRFTAVAKGYAFDVKA